jgi:hypothetical protein
MKQMQDGLRSALTEQDIGGRSYLKTLTLTLILAVSYAVAVWALVQPNLSPVVFVPGLSVSVICSLLLGKMLAEK